MAPLSTRQSDLKRVVEFVRLQYSQPLTVRAVATAVKRSAPALRRMFRTDMGMSVRDYVVHVRLDRAAELIVQGVKIDAVAACVGYRSKKNLYRHFRRAFGSTPGEYRRRHLTVEKTSRVDEIVRLWNRVRDLRAMARRTREKVRALVVEAEQIMASEFETFPLPLLATNTLGRYVAANDAALLVTAYGTEDLPAKGPRDLFPGFDGDENAVWQIIFPPPLACPNAMLRQKNGNVVPVHVVTTKNHLRRTPAMREQRLAPSRG